MDVRSADTGIPAVGRTSAPLVARPPVGAAS